MTTALATLDRPDPLPSLIAAAPADRHPAAIYLAHLAPGSRATMRRALAICAEIISSGRHDARTLPWAELRYKHTQAIRTVLAEKYAPAGANKILAALRGVLKECWRLGLVSAEDYHRAADLPGVRGERLPRGRALSQGELRALFEVCARDEGPAGVRDAALLAVLYGGGLRRAEATQLDAGDYTLGTGELRVLHAKGGKQRLVYVNGGGAAAVAAWLELRGQEPGPLFMPITQTGVIVHRRITAQVVRWILRKRAREAAGVQSCSPHDFRRTFISDLLDAGADLSVVQKLAGHANVTTTQRYDRRGEAAKAQAAARLHVPYVAARPRRQPHP